MSSQGRPVGFIIAGIALTAAALLTWMIVRAGDDSAPAAAAGRRSAGGGSPGSPRGAPQRTGLAAGRGLRAGAPRRRRRSVGHRDRRQRRPRPGSPPGSLHAALGLGAAPGGGRAPGV